MYLLSFCRPPCACSKLLVSCSKLYQCHAVNYRCHALNRIHVCMHKGGECSELELSNNNINS